MGEVPPPLHFRPKTPSTPALKLVYSGVYPQFCHLPMGTRVKDFSFYFKKYGTCAYNSGKQNLACPELALEMIAEKRSFFLAFGEGMMLCLLLKTARDAGAASLRHGWI